MGQLALGLRSLLVKASVFFVMAALLAWALGGTLFPRPERVELGSVAFAGKEWHLRLSVGGDHPGEARFDLMSRSGDERPERFLGPFSDAAGIVVVGEGLYAAVRDLPIDTGRWTLVRVASDGTTTREPLADRLAVEQSLAELRAEASSPDGDR
ncbi:MAG: hypothetical protein KDA22_15935 [Phycisphaerales bacterium]|nr:hypothetical protein [Phycisphaerales bacterium]